MLNRDEMLKALDLDATPASSETGDIQIDTQAPASPVSQAPNAITDDRWTRRQGRQLRDRLDQEVQEGGEKFAKRPIHDLDQVDLTDLHMSTFDPTPEIVPDGACSDKLKYKYFQELMDNPKFHELRKSTVLDDAATDLAIERLADGLVELRGKEGEDGDGEGDEEGDIGIGRVAGKVVNKAKEDVQDLQDAREGLGLGDGAGGQYNVQKTLDLYKRLRQDANLKTIINLAGKYLPFGQSQQRRKVEHGQDDYVGVTVGGNLARLAQSEFVNLGIPELEDDVCLRLLNSQAMIQEWRGVEPVAKGPMIILLDESSSMNDRGKDGFSRIQHAKAIALAFAYNARQQNRWCALVGWSSCNQRRSVVLAPGQWDQDKLIAWLSAMWNGGTEPPIGDMPMIYQSVGAPVGRTDLVYITDGTVYIDTSAIDMFKAWKKEVQAKVISLIVSSSPGGMNMISDETHVVQSLGMNDAVGRVLAI